MNPNTNTGGETPPTPPKYNNASGCSGCLGGLVAFFALWGVSAAVLVQFMRGGIAVDSSLFEFFDILGGLQNSPYLLPLSLAALALGLGVLGLTQYRDIRRAWAYHDELEQTASTPFDKQLAARRRKNRKVGKFSTRVGFILFLAPMYVLPFTGLFTQLIQSNKIYTLPEEHAILAEAFGVLPLGLCLIGAVMLVAGLTISGMGAMNFGGSRHLNKPGVVHEELSKTFTNLFYDPYGGLNEDLVFSTGLARRGNSYKTNDYISGTYRGTPFEQADVTVCQRTEHTYYDKDNNRQSETRTTEIFSGRWLVITLPKAVQGEVHALSRAYPAVNPKRLAEKCEKVQLEDTAFNKLFTVFATVPQDVFYIFTPALIERLKAYVTEGKMGRKEGLGLYCKGNQMHIAVNGSKDAFEMLFLGAQSEAEVRGRVREDVSLITDIINTIAAP